MSTATATSTATASTIYSVTSALSRIVANHPATTTLGYTNNLELDTVAEATSPGFGTRLFLANLSSSTLSAMVQLAATALASGGQATIHYQVVQSSSAMVAVITSLSYNGKTINA